tara:strand:+ start:1008 stop:1292 length:285 start_codon:yes stop_codon:yes gene_type:complete
MCGCNKNVVDLQQYKIYTIMAEYKAKLSSGATSKDGYRIQWAIATQEQLAHAYEVMGFTDLVEKIEKNNTIKEDGENNKKKSGKSKKKESNDKE